MRITEILAEAWSQKYKSSINCSHPRGFSQKAHCAGKKKHNESVEMEMVCEDCGMCETHGNHMMEVKQRLDAKCWKGKHKEGTKIKGGVRVNNCVPNESIEEDSKGLYYNVNKRKAAGISRDADSPKAPTAQAWRDAAKTAKKESVTKGDNSSQVGFDARFIEEPVTYPMVDVENSRTRRMEQKMATVVGPAEDGSFKVSFKENPRPGANSGSDWLPINSEGIGLNLITDTGPRTFTPARWCLEAIKKHKEELYGKQGGLHEQFDIIEEMVESLALEHGVDADVIWEDFESVDDSELLETAAWRRKEGKSKKGGLNAKGVASYRRENPGSKLQTAVTTKPSKLKPGSKAAKRRKSFCARMGGVKGPMKKPNGKPTRKALALRKWNC
jgi:hypothetical protein